MERADVLVVGSGASGIHFAQSLLQKKYRVMILDVGWQTPKKIPIPGSFAEFKQHLDDPVAYFNGSEFQSVVLAESQEDYETNYYGFPPSKSHVFQPIPNFEFSTKGFTPLLSFAQGGLAEAWTGGVYPLNDGELADFPFNYSTLGPYYSEVANRIGINGAEDDLKRFFPSHEYLQPGLELDKNGRLLYDAYKKHSKRINEKYDAYLGRSRGTALSQPKNNRQSCVYCCRCLWGCPNGAFYTPSITLNSVRQMENFNYHPSTYISHFEFNGQGHIKHIIGYDLTSGKKTTFTAEFYVLAAGTINSAAIFLRSMLLSNGEPISLHGLMDNRQILVPFYNLRMLGKPYSKESYQFHQLALGIEAENPKEYIHGQITTLKSTSIHPIVQNIPMDMNIASKVFKDLRSGLAVLNLNLWDKRREENRIWLDIDNEGMKLRINYVPSSQEPELIRSTLKKVRRVLLELGCIAIPGMTKIRPMGASVHYSGVLPMSGVEKPLHVSPNCQSYDVPNLYFVDGTSIPFLPAKNITFTLMANAVRVASEAF